MPDLQKLNETKEKIISTISLKGPSFPTRIARETEMNPLFVSAFLSELVSQNKLKISSLKVGSSPLYYLPGQENLLENFIEHLNQKEKEAFLLLKNSNVLEDEKQLPAIRVALRNIKDFAVPLSVRINNELKIFWKFSMLQNEEAKEIINSLFTKKEEVKETFEKEKQQKQAEKIEKEIEEKKEITPRKKAVKPKKEINSEFLDKIKEYLQAKDIEILQEVLSKKKEFTSKIRIDTQFGKQEFYLISKEKKKITEDDLAIAMQKAQTEKMPALILSQGDLDKKAQEYLKEWKNMIKFEKIKM